MKKTLIVSLLAASAFLTGCGGGGDTTPTAVVVPNVVWTKGVEISKVCAVPMEDYKTKMQSVQSTHTLDYRTIGINTPMPIVDGVITKSYIDIRDALWEAAPYVAITKPRQYRDPIFYTGMPFFAWNDITYPDGTTTYSQYHADYWKEANTGTFAIMWKKSDFHWAVWVIKNGKCGYFNMENGNYKGFTLL